MTLSVIKLSTEEAIIINMMRRNSFQEILLQVQDSVITSANQVSKYRRKKGGGLVSGHIIQPPSNLTSLSQDEADVIKMIREKPFQQITIQIKNSLVEVLNQTVKFRKKNGLNHSSD